MTVPILNKQVIYPKEETLIYPMIDRNDQRKDIATPLLGIVDWAQCKGNSFQNILNFVGLSSNDSKIKTELSTMSTYAYYSGFEINTYLINLYLNYGYLKYKYLGE